MHNESETELVWLFSVNAPGARFRDVTILHCVRTEPLGEVTLTSSGKAVKVGRGSALLLRVDGSRPEEAQAHTTLRERRGNNKFTGCGGIGFVKPGPSQPAIHSILQGVRRW